MEEGEVLVSRLALDKVLNQRVDWVECKGGRTSLRSYVTIT